MTQDLYYYDSGYIDDSYFVYTADAELSGSAQATMTAVVGVIKESVVALESTFTSTAVISHLEGADLFAFTNAALAAQVEAIRDNNVQVTSAFTQTTAGSKFVYVGADYYADSSISAANARVRFSEAAIDAAFSLAADVSVIIGGEVVEASGAWSSTSAVEVQGDVVKEAIVSSSSTSSLSVIAEVTKEFVSAITSTATVTAQVRVNYDYWISTDNTSAGSRSNALVLDSDLNSYMTGYEYVSGIPKSILVKSDRYGDILYKKLLSGGTYDLGNKIAKDSSNNIYVTGYNNGNALLAKYNSAGAVQWQKSLGTTTNTESGSAIAIGSDNAIYIGGRLGTSSDANQFGMIAKYDTSGNLTWQKQISQTFSEVKALSVDSSGNVFAIMNNSSGSNQYSLLVKLNSSGAIQLQRLLDVGTGWMLFSDVQVDTSGNIYLVGSKANTGGGSSNSIIYKLNSSGAFQWRSGFVPASGSATFESIAIDSNSDLIVAGVSGSNGVLAKFSSSGAVLWQNQFSGIDSFTGVKLDTNNDIYCTAYSDTNETFSIRLPANGSGLNTYGSYAYTTSALSLTTATVNISTPTYTVSNSSMVNNAGSLTESSGSTAVDIIKITNVGQTEVFEAALSSTTSLSSTGGFNKPTSAAMSAAFSEAVSITAAKILESSPTVSSQLTLTAESILAGSATLNADGFVASIIGRIRPEVADLTVTSSMSINAGNSVVGEVNATASTALTIDALRIQSSAVSVTASNSLAIDAQRLRFGIADLTSTATVDAVVRKIARISKGLSVTSALSATPIEIPSYEWDERIRSLFHFNNNYNDEISNTGVTHTGTGTFVSSLTGFGQQYRAPASSYITVDREEANIPYAQYSIDFKLSQIVSPGAGSEVTVFQMRSFYGGTTYFYHELRFNYDTGLIKAVRWREDQGSSSASVLKTASTTIRAGSTDTISVRTTTGVTPTEIFVNGVSGGAFDWLSGVNAPGYFKLGNIENWSGSTGVFGFDEFRLIIGTYIDRPTTVPYAPNQNAAAFINSSATLTADYLRVKFGEAATSSTSTLTATGLRIKKSAVTVNAVLTQVTIGQRNAVLSAPLTVTTALSSPINRRRPGNSAVSATVTASITAIKATVAESSQSTRVTMLCSPNRIRDLNSDQSAESNAVIAAIKTSHAQAALQVSAFEFDAAVKTGQGFVDCVINSELTVVTRITSGSRAVITAVTTVNATPWNVLEGAADITLESAQTTIPTYLRRNESAMSCTSTMSITGAKIVKGSADLEVTTGSSIDSTNSAIRGVQSQVVASFTALINNQILRLGSADLITTSTVLFVAGVLVRCNADLHCEGFVLSAGRVIHLDPFLTLTIEPELRTTIIRAESRLLTVEEETRLNKIKGYPV